MRDLDRILECISPDVSYDEWLKVGMALKHEGYDVGVWDSWSSGSSKYKPNDCIKKWDTFKESGDIVTGGTLIQMAKDYGYRPEEDRALSWDDEIQEPTMLDRDYRLVDVGYVKPQTIPPLPKHYDPVGELKEYLSEMFEPDEYVGYCDKLKETEDGKYVPDKGLCKRTAGDLLARLEKGGFEEACIRAESKGGAFIRPNPLDGTGISDSNVTKHRYVLLESDTDSIEKQYALYQELKLPIKFLIHSGNKSLHAIVKVQAENEQQYKQRVKFIYEFCEKNGLELDQADKNPSRYSRMPGIKRGDNYQYIIARDIGEPTYRDWKRYVELENDMLPPEVSLRELLENLPPLKDELIEGVLRVGHKLLISGPSKAGKSFALMELAIAIATGGEWLGHKCKKGKVFYLNLELDSASFAHRFYEMTNGIDYSDNIVIWNLRGKATPMDKLEDKLINRCREKEYSAIIIDPIYKVITGDENNATEMSKFCSYFDTVALETSASLIYCHHHSKGAVGKYANAADRSSGSGVFARDPDAILDLAQLQLDEFHVNRYGGDMDTLSAWELTGTLREFPPMKPIRMWFDYPHHIVDENNWLSDCKYSGMGQRGIGISQEAKEDATANIRDAFDAGTIEVNDAMALEQIKEETGYSESKIKNNIKAAGLSQATLVDGTRVLFNEGNQSIRYKGEMYHPGANKKGRNSRWQKDLV